MGARVVTALPHATLRLYLIRHGETEWCLTRQHTGRTEVPLNENGKQDAQALGERLGPITFIHVFTSPRQRAQDTCALAGLSRQSSKEPDLAEWNYGEYEGETSADIRRDLPDWNIFRDGCPRGEMPAQVSDRADRLIARLRELDGNIALFTHGQFGCVLAARWIGLPVIDGPHFLLGTASISILGYDPDHPDIPVIDLWNSCARSEASTLHHPGIANVMTAKQRAIQRWENEGGEIPDEPRNLKAQVNGSKPK
jgi:broad specificity phosphatase PhoE